MKNIKPKKNQYNHWKAYQALEKLRNQLDNILMHAYGKWLEEEVKEGKSPIIDYPVSSIYYGDEKQWMNQ